MKEVITYLMLVGLPILGLVGILQLGHTLDAPPALYGVWVADSAAAAEPCSERTLRLLRTGIVVQQSGRHLAASFVGGRDQRLTGRLAGDTVRLSGVVVDTVSEGAATCEPRQRLALTLQLADSRSGGGLSGVVRMPDCAGCPPLPVRFTIVPARAAGGSPAAHR